VAEKETVKLPWDKVISAADTVRRRVCEECPLKECSDKCEMRHIDFWENLVVKLLRELGDVRVVWDREGNPVELRLWPTK